MGTIKSSLEIAMERTKDVAADREQVEAAQQATEGKKLVSKFFDVEDSSMEELLKGFPKEQLPHVRKGVQEALLANLTLPADEYAVKRNQRAGEGFAPVVNNARRLKNILSQLESFFQEYLGERSRLREEVDTAYAPRLRQKEEEMARKTGQRVRIDPNSDPEYVGLLRRNLVMLEERYGGVLAQVKGEIESMLS